MNKQSFSESYKKSGVDITAGYKAVELMKEYVDKTRTEGCCDTLGGFGGCYDISSLQGERTVLVSGTDGVGTKLKLAFLMGRDDTVGIDCVAMCVNDVICTGAKPIIFLDYIACGKNVPEKIASIVKGVAEGCVQAGAALVGGETAEMPGFYREDEYDLAGFSVGIVDREAMFDKESVREGDILIALPSSGVHSNGFSLVRKVFDIENHPEKLRREYPSLGRSLGEALLEPTKIYVKDILSLKGQVTVKSVAHITGGGFYENIPRALPDGLCASIREKDVRIHPIFPIIQKEGDISDKDMFNTFNMGVGMVVVVAKEEEAKALSLLSGSYRLGTVASGSGVNLW
jgi:phosphoribosylformylglycinamidine cyclo-ligase